MYTGKAELTSDNCSDLLALSNEYDLVHLKLASELFIEQGIDNNNVISIYQAATVYRAGRLKSNCLQYMVKNYNSVKNRNSFSTLDSVEKGITAAIRKQADTKQYSPVQKVEPKKNASKCPVM